MKWILVVALIFIHNPLIATTQYSQAQCDRLKNQREHIRKRMNAGYGVAEGNWLNERDRELFQIIGLRCNQVPSPVSQTLKHPTGNANTPVRALTSEPAKSAQAALPDWSAQNAIFSGKKAAAWADFYQVPAHCRQKTLSETDFVKCADHKAEQRRQFITKWEKQQHTAVSISPTYPHTSESNSASAVAILEAFIAENKNVALPASPIVSVQTASLYQLDFRWFGLSFVVMVLAAGWLIWRK